jgi:hypothetical protein
MTEEQMPEGFRRIQIKPGEEPSWTHLPEVEVRQVAVGARAAIIEWLNNPAKVLYWRGSGESNIDKAPIISPIIANLKEQYPEQSRRIQENPYLGPLDISIVEAPGLAKMLTTEWGSSGKQVF